ncbi:MAG TPA: LysR family transcriptional regulator [Castellaniella sp.]|jgi:DNA-binding transcriptional LysR family regulator|nr:LysR family transcriptional regulator [Castellaniella sp.]
MNLRQLEILRAVIHAGTTVGAASTLHMSQPAISNAIKAMERSLGFALFSRVHNRLVPTREATVLLNQAEPMFTIQEMVEQTARHLRDGTMGHINIVATAEPSDSLLPQVLTRFIKQHPDVRVSMETLRLDNVLEYVETGAADIGFAIEPYARPTLKYIPLSVLDIVCLCPADSPLCQLPYVTPNHLKDVPLINASTRSRLHSAVQEAFRRSKVDYSPVMNVRFMNLAGLFVEEGLGAAIMDALTASSPRYRGVCIIPFRPRIRVKINAIVSSAQPMQRITRRLLDYIYEDIDLMLSTRTSVAASGQNPAPAGDSASNHD